MTTSTQTKPNALRVIAAEALSLGRQTLELGWTLVKIMVPVLLLTKILQDLGVITWIGHALTPVMGLVGLPGDMALVWAAGMLVSPYLSLMMFATLAPSAPLSVAQVTVLGSMILMAHSLLVELRVVQKSGLRISVQLLLRIGGALFYGWLLHVIYQAGGWLQGPADFLLGDISQPATGWLAWGWEQVKSLAMIFVIIYALMAVMRILERAGIIDLLKRLLSPLLNLLGMGKEAAPITIIGIVLGIVLGGGLVIKEAQSGKMSPREVFFSLALMCLFHSLIEDTAIVLLMGAHLSGLLWLRLVYALLIVFLLGRLVNALPEEVCERYLFVGARG